MDESPLQTPHRILEDTRLIFNSKVVPQVNVNDVEDDEMRIKEAKYNR